MYEDVMPIEWIPDWEARLRRQDAFWAREVIDRPVAHIVCPKEPEVPEPPQKAYPTLRDRWWDAEAEARREIYNIRRTEHMGDALPRACPNLGPELFSACFGCELEFGERTSWSKPNLESWDDLDKVVFSEENPYYRKILEMTDTFLEIGKGEFHTGLWDIHPGGDAIAAFRDPQNLAMDMVDCPEKVKALLEEMNRVFFRVYDHLHGKLAAAGQATATWTGIVSTKKWYIPSNDFSCMISAEMFDDVFLPYLREEIRFLEASIYHLDGPNALKHLDSLLAIPELDAVQWVYGAGAGRASDWMDVYKRIQAAGKGIQIGLDLDEVDTFVRELKPEGVWLGMNVPDRETGEAVLKKLAAWT